MTIGMGDLFTMTGGMIEDDNGEAHYSDHVGDLIMSDLHLVRDEFDDNNGPTAMPDTDEVLRCKRCAALVLDVDAAVHLAWHQQIETPL